MNFNYRKKFSLTLVQVFLEVSLMQVAYRPINTLSNKKNMNYFRFRCLLSACLSSSSVNLVRFAIDHTTFGCHINLQYPEYN